MATLKFSKPGLRNVPKVSAPKVTGSGLVRQDEQSMSALSSVPPGGLAAGRAGGSKAGTGARGGAIVTASKINTPQQQPSEEPKQPRSRQAAESKLQQMITCTGPDLFVQGTIADAKSHAHAHAHAQHDEELEGEMYAGHGSGLVPAPSLEDASAACKEAAPFDMILEFMTAVMTREYERALEIGKKIIQYEPDNKIVADFIPVLEEIVTFSDSEDETSDDSSAESASGSSEEEETDSEGSDTDDSELSPSSSAESDEDDDDETEAEAGTGTGTATTGGESGGSTQDSCTSEDDDEQETSGSQVSDAGYNSMK